MLQLLPLKPLPPMLLLPPTAAVSRQDLDCPLSYTHRHCCPALQGIADGRVNLIGRMAPITDDAEKAAAKAAYLAKHPNSFWVEFGDFRWAAPWAAGLAGSVARWAAGPRNSQHSADGCLPAMPV